MLRILPALALVFGLMSAASSAQAQVAWGNDLRLVSDTKVPDAQGNFMSLCQLVDYANFFFVPVYTTVEGYALSTSGCEGEVYRTVPPELFAEMQARSVVPTDLPAKPSLALKDLAWGHAWIIVIGIAVAFKVMAYMIGGGRRPRRKAAGSTDMLTVHSLVAMSQVAVADGRIDEAEITQISSILTRLTGSGYSPDRVRDMLSRLNPSPSDLAQVGQDLSERDRQIVLEAALNIAVADGEIHPSEYAVVSDLAQRMRVGGDQFRSALARISAHIQTAQPA